VIARCASGLSSASLVLEAIRSAFEQASDSLGCQADFAILFISGDRLSQLRDEILALWKEIAPGIPFFGGSAESLVGIATEIEGKCAASILLVSGIPKPEIVSVECIKTPDGPSIMGLSDEWLATDQRSLMVVACPLTFSVELLANALEYQRHSPSESIVPLVGGYCSSQDWEQPNLVFCDDTILLKGAAILKLPNGWNWKCVISQGCRPVGDPFVITQMEGQTIVSLGGRPAMSQLQELFRKLPTHEQQMISRSLMIGRTVNEYSQSFSHGEFLIRAVQGVDPDNQGLVVTDRFQVGQTVRFHVRDAEAATADLNSLLEECRQANSSPLGGVLFTCNGRGSRMFAEESLDARRIQYYLSDLPLTGIFAAGEFAPIANQNLVHGFTAILNLLVAS
jgi:small ligand-binding sensory domain FIST